MGCFPSSGKVQKIHVQPPAACVAGCGKPSWNGQAGEFCSQGCQKSFHPGGGGHAGALSSPSAVAACATPGCGKPTWNGQQGEYCSKFCQTQHDGQGGAVVCATPNCGKPTWNGVPGGYCSKNCKVSAAGGVPMGALCATPGCGKPTWNGQPGEYCSKYCKASGGASQYGAVCANPGCGQPSWNGQQGEFCSKKCKMSTGATGATGAAGAGLCALAGCGKPSWNGLPGEYCSKVCRGSRFPTVGSKSTCSRLSPGSVKYNSIKTQYEQKWDTARLSCRPTPIRAVYEVLPKAELRDRFQTSCHQIGNVKVFGHGTNPGNVQRRFHGTRITCRPSDPWVACSDSKCSACRIIEDGFDMGMLGAWSGNKGVFGGGIYFTSMSSTAKGYGLDKNAGYHFDKGNWMDPRAGNAVLIANIACGRVETVTGSCSHSLDRSEFESRKVDKASGADELIVFHNSQALIRAIIVF